MRKLVTFYICSSTITSPSISMSLMWAILTRSCPPCWHRCLICGHYLMYSSFSPLGRPSSGKPSISRQLQMCSVSSEETLYRLGGKHWRSSQHDMSKNWSVWGKSSGGKLLISGQSAIWKCLRRGRYLRPFRSTGANREHDIRRISSTELGSKPRFRAVHGTKQGHS